MIRYLGEQTDLELFFEPFREPPAIGVRFVAPPINTVTASRIVRLPFGNIALEDCEHDYARGLMLDPINELWVVSVCRKCEHIAAPAFAELR